MTVLKLNSDNFENQLMTAGVYEIIRLTMSTGDFHTHTVEKVQVDDFKDVLTIEEYFADDQHE